MAVPTRAIGAAEQASTERVMAREWAVASAASPAGLVSASSST
ncbi:MAG: hypothetical protein ACYCXY_04925 [Acidimicrobiales bacterium]